MQQTDLVKLMDAEVRVAGGQALCRALQEQRRLRDLVRASALLPFEKEVLWYRFLTVLLNCRSVNGKTR